MAAWLCCGKVVTTPEAGNFQECLLLSRGFHGSNARRLIAHGLNKLQTRSRSSNLRQPYAGMIFPTDVWTTFGDQGQQTSLPLVNWARRSPERTSFGSSSSKSVTNATSPDLARGGGSSSLKQFGVVDHLAVPSLGKRFLLD